MSILTLDDNDFVTCDCCDMCYQVIFNRDPIYNSIEYCPFCGSEVEICEGDIIDVHQTDGELNAKIIKRD